MSKQALEWLNVNKDRFSMLTRSQRTVLLVLCEHHTAKYGHASLTKAKIAKAAMYAEQTINDAIRVLKSMGLITSDEQRKNGRQVANIYFICELEGVGKLGQSGGRSATPEIYVQGVITDPPTHTRARTLRVNAVSKLTGHKTKGVH